MADDSDLSAYELERLANMRRNAEHLQSLGLEARAPVVRQSSGGAPKKRPRPVPAPAAEGVRRSSRQRVPVLPYTDDTPLPDARRSAISSPGLPYEGPDEPLPAEDGAEAVSGAVSLAERPAPDPGTSRGIALDVDALLERHLGQHMPGRPTKEDAVKAMTGGRGARFSKYAGSLEWRNAIVLWVNVGGSDYKNMFKPDASGELTMTWYASERQNEGTPVVQRLLATADKAADEVLLFCRLQGEPYVCCGRLAYDSHVPRRQPLKFVWRLRDAAAVRGQPAFDAVLAPGAA
jgi:hypothetical protein